MSTSLLKRDFSFPLESAYSNSFHTTKPLKGTQASPRKGKSFSHPKQKNGKAGFFFSVNSFSIFYSLRVSFQKHAEQRGKSFSFSRKLLSSA
jgi:hypothetical protein